LQAAAVAVLDVAVAVVLGGTAHPYLALLLVAALVQSLG
jgi:hypothetical protein